jgi:hypothetical protein
MHLVRGGQLPIELWFLSVLDVPGRVILPRGRPRVTHFVRGGNVFKRSGDRLQSLRGRHFPGDGRSERLFVLPWGPVSKRRLGHCLPRLSAGFVLLEWRCAGDGVRPWNVLKRSGGRLQSLCGRRFPIQHGAIGMHSLRCRAVFIVGESDSISSVRRLHGGAVLIVRSTFLHFVRGGDVPTLHGVELVRCLRRGLLPERFRVHLLCLLDELLPLLHRGHVRQRQRRVVG